MSCKYCGMYPYHLPACPEYDGRSPELGTPIGTCSCCDNYIYEDEHYSFISPNILYCSDCLEDMDEVDEEVSDESDED